jgi:hypothetical protein
VPLCPPQIPHGPTQDRNQASAVGGRRLTAWGTSNFVHGLWPTLREEKGHIQIRSRPAGIVYDFAHGQSLTPREGKSSCACLK